MRPASEIKNPNFEIIYGTGKFNIQYERVLGKTTASDSNLKFDPELSKLATGKLELEIKSAPPAEPEKKDPPKQEKEGFTAWGKELSYRDVYGASGGLQAGLGFRPGEKRAYSHGETVTLVVRVRNVGKEAVKFNYITAYFVDWPPSVTDGEGKAGPQIRSPGKGGDYNQVKANLAPGKEIELAD